MPTSIVIYPFCVVVLIFAFAGPSYIHPDELFQSQEIILAAAGQRYANVPWEFADVKIPSRSVVPPAVFVGFPLAVAGWLGQHSPEISAVNWVASSGVAIRESNVVPRIFVASLTVLGVIASFKIAAAHQISAPATAAALISSWVGCIMMGRPFSNSTEGLVLLVLLLLAVRLRRIIAVGGSALSIATMSLALGTVAAFGLFVRFTFAAFALPTVILCAAEAAWVACGRRPVQRAKGMSARLHGAAAFGWMQFTLLAVFAVLGAVICITAIVAVDSVFFGGFASVSDLADTVLAALTGSSATAMARLTAGLRIAPWNNFVYNLDPANLAQHGIHPRFQHALVNGHIMYGPAWLLVWAFVGTASIAALRQRRAASTTAVSHAAANDSDDQAALKRAFQPWHLLLWSGCTLVCGTAVLSTAPHQEPRFLAPLMWPVAFIMAHCLSDGGNGSTTAFDNPIKQLVSRRLPRIAFWVAWCAFNLVAGTLFGFRHQAGLVEAAASLGASAKLASVRALRIAAASHPQRPSSGEHGSLVSELTVHAAFAGAYMVPHTALQLGSAALLAQGGSSSDWRQQCSEVAPPGPSGGPVPVDLTAVLRPAPWAQPADGAVSQRIRSEGGLVCFRVPLLADGGAAISADRDACASAASPGLLHLPGFSSCLNASVEPTVLPQAAMQAAQAASSSHGDGFARLRMHLHEFGDADAAGLRHFLEACQSGLAGTPIATFGAAAVGVDTAGFAGDTHFRQRICLLYTPVSVWHQIAGAVAAESQQRCTASLQGVLPRYLSMESPPTGVSGWLAALLPESVGLPVLALLRLPSAEEGGLGLAIAQVSCH